MSPLCKGGLGGILLVGNAKHVNMTTSVGGLAKDSVVLYEQIRVIDKRRMTSKIGNIGGGESSSSSCNSASDLGFRLIKGRRVRSSRNGLDIIIYGASSHATG